MYQLNVIDYQHVDMNNISNVDGGGSCTAAAFLQACRIRTAVIRICYHFICIYIVYI